jgi:hypothetical protein
MRCSLSRSGRHNSVMRANVASVLALMEVGNMTKLDEDMEDLEMWLGQFYEEHGRGPHSSHEFFHWYNDRILQLEAKGLEFRDGKFVPKAP